MEDPLKVMISEEMSQKVYGKENPMGKTLDINSTNFDGTVSFEVVGVYKSPAANRHLRPQILLSYATLHHFIGKEIDASYEWLNLYTFLKLPPQTDVGKVNEQINASLAQHHGEKLKAAHLEWELHLQPVPGIHTSTAYSGEYEQGVDGSKLKYFVWIAAFVLLMVYLNSINIANARALNRAKEIGVRKVSGGSKKQLFFQFMLESCVINFIAVSVAAIGVFLLGEQLLTFLGLPFHVLYTTQTFSALIGLWLFGTIASGVYPAMVLTSFSPSQSFKGVLKFKLKTAFARPLLISQLVCCLLILSGILTVYFQLSHMRKQELGITLEDKIIVRSPMLFTEGSGNYQKVIQQHFNRIAGVEGVGVTNEIPGNEVYWKSDQFFREGAEKSGIMYTMLNVGDNYFDVFDISLKAGRYFNTDLEEGSEAIINEKAREALGYETNEAALGQKLMYSGWGEPAGVDIVGVVDDYRQQGVHLPVNPMVLNYAPGDLNYYIVDVVPGTIDKVLPELEATFGELFPASPFDYYFLDEHFDKQYKSEAQFVQLFGLAALVAVIIAIMGIIGVSTQLIIQRNKEVSIRKIMGASFGNVFYMISKEYLYWLAICFSIGIPLSYYLFSQWLDGFLIRIELGWWFFAFPGLMVTLIFIGSTIFQTVKIALVNPAHTLKSE